MTKDSRKDAVFNPPNTLTLVRVACIPLVALCLVFPGKAGSFMAAFFFGMAFATDFLDGYLARRYGIVTSLGKFLDPLADKLLVSATMIMLIPLHRIPAWAVLLIVAREMAVTGLRAMAAKEGIVIQAGALGKFKTAFQSSATIGLCLHYEYFSVDFHAVGMALLWVALVLTVWSGWAYFRKFCGVFMPKGR